MAVCSWCSLFPCVMSRVNESLGVFNMTFQCLPLSRWKVKYASHLLWLGVRLARPSRSFPHHQNPYSGVIQDINDQFPSCGAPCPPCNYEVGPVPCETHGTCTPCSCLHLVLLASLGILRYKIGPVPSTHQRRASSWLQRSARIGGLSPPLFDSVASRFPHLSAESTGPALGRLEWAEFQGVPSIAVLSHVSPFYNSVGLVGLADSTLGTYMYYLRITQSL
ncbi:hypothetical protein QBC33DRAFT_216047 [Phialemonium atrogriseum]|uniref:Uncharacterized protein n=1 Tax=Phialemonium atrogriseum TaxID=1093897 RepID=A0AAJ0C877_9PEZI|nr:uncharacterized protein QBC33DRAFT_216047 [Phialemonium atrogriseum]KAK1770778.1 hypothetical protein QBC33DRAFT_216047 [Phialemonium atrogriseum]